MENKFDSGKSLVIIFGAKDDSEHETPFSHSAKGMEDYFLNYLKIKQDNILNLLSPSVEPRILANPTSIAHEMMSFLEKRQANMTDLFFYYVGHGTSMEGRYYLLIPSTTTEDLIITGFAFDGLKAVIKKARQVRCYIILDACFSGKVLDILPRTSQGTSLFCSSSDQRPSNSSGSDQCTMFTDVLLKVIKAGDASISSPEMSFYQLKSLVSKSIKEIYKEKAVIPELHHVGENDIIEIGIFPNKQYKKPGPNTMAEVKWHIITSGKGGVGKTLLSLFLVTHYVGNGVMPLVIDLNGVNTDLKRLINEEDDICQTGGEEPPHYLPISMGDCTLIIVSVHTPHSYLLGWITNPYQMYTPNSFFSFLSSLRDYLPKINKEFDTAVETIIIDTNYHFCNLFPKEEEEGYRSFAHWGTDRFFIWFIWVYRQLYNCYQQRQQADNDFYKQVQFNTDVNVMLRTASTIERVVTAGRYTTPFVHVINPMSLTESSPIQELLKVLQGRNVQIVPELHRLAELEVASNSFRFNPLVNLMVNAQTKAGVPPQFSEMLKKLSLVLSKRPKNLFTFHKFQENLAKKGVSDIQIQDLEVYQTFEDFFSVLLETE